MFISPVPTPGSSGGPIIDLNSGAVVGIIRGSRMENQITGVKGWATSAESIFEVNQCALQTSSISDPFRCFGYPGSL